MNVPWARPFWANEEKELVIQTLESGWLSQGKNVEAFEKRVAELSQAKYTVAVNSGTAALDVALKLFKIKAGDEILVPAFAYIASVNCILYQGAIPVFVDVDPVTFNMDPKDAEKKVTKKTKAIIALDYAGQAADWKALRTLADQHELFLLEDAAPSFGGEYKGKALGTIADIGITSFHAAKIFNSVEGGMILLNDKEWDKRARVIRSQGESPDVKYSHIELGHNYRMSDLHAAVGLAQLQRYYEVLENRAQIANYYSKNLNGDCVLPKVLDGNKHAWFLYPILVKDRDSLRAKLNEQGVSTNVSWPNPCYAHNHLEKFYQEPCPVTEQVCQEVLCLPLYHGMTEKEAQYVVETLNKLMK